MTRRPPDDIQRHGRPEPQGEALASMRALEAVRAPASLHRSIEELTGRATAPRRRRHAPLRRRLAGAGAGALAAALAAGALLLFGAGAGGSPTVLAVSHVALEPARLAAPAESSRQQGMLDASVEGVSFPYWGGWRGWRTAGARSDRIAGHAITTVFYTDRTDGRRIGYAIVAGAPLSEPAPGAAVDRAGVRFRVLSSAGATIVTWREGGHTCILAGRGVSADTLLDLVS